MVINIKKCRGWSMFVVFKQKAVPATTAGTALKKSEAFALIVASALRRPCTG
jgi:hypothetical protein